MDLRKLPPSMVLALGLVACGDDGPPESETGPCLSVDPTVVGSATDTGSGSSSGTAGSSSGAASTGDTTVSACLSPEPETTGTDSGSGSGSGSDSGSGSGTDTGTTGGMGAAEPAAPSRTEAMERVLERGTLPADVAARLRHTLGKD